MRFENACPTFVLKAKPGKLDIKRRDLVFYEDDSISNWPDLFLTDRHSQDFHSVFGHHI